MIFFFKDGFSRTLLSVPEDSNFGVNAGESLSNSFIGSSLDYLFNFIFN